MEISKYVKAALLLKLSHATQGLNAKIAALTASYGIEPLSFDWNPGGPQFFLANVTPDDLDDSTPNKYPILCMYGVRSYNTHRSMGRKFSGTVDVAVKIWLTHKASSVGKAGAALEVMCDALEDALNDMFTDGNWPQSYGANSTVCLPPACERTGIIPAGEGSQQGIVLRFQFTVDKN